MKYKGNGYKTWLRIEDRKLVTWSNYDKDLRDFCKGKNNNYILIGKLQPNQNPYCIDDKGIYRCLYGKKEYYYTFDSDNNILNHAKLN